MHSWPRPAVPSVSPALEGRPLLYDTLTEGLVGSGPGVGPARIYVCGITPYDATHMGHANTYVAFDLLNRTWRDCGFEVIYTQNVTDIDDPLLERADRTGVDWAQLGDDQVALFREDMAALRVIPPEYYVGAVESIPDVVALIESMRDTGTIYQVDDVEYPDWYFAVNDAPGFGELSGLTEDAARATFAERGGDPDRPGKRDPLDCLVWQLAREGEPSWDSSLGRGRPGWHIECTAIALRYLGVTFDVQAGGSDLVFPHHEMCAAEGIVASGGPFAEAYLHSGMVGLDGEKMSKSQGNLVLVSALREQGVQPMAIRLALLGHHYRSDWSWTAEDLSRAQERLVRWRIAVEEGREVPAAEVIDEMRAALREDLNAPAALAAVDAWAASARAPGRAADSAAVAAGVDALLGVDLAGTG